MESKTYSSTHGLYKKTIGLKKKVFRQKIAMSSYEIDGWTKRPSAMN